MNQIHADRIPTRRPSRLRRLATFAAIASIAIAVPAVALARSDSPASRPARSAVHRATSAHKHGRSDTHGQSSKDHRGSPSKREAQHGTHASNVSDRPKTSHTKQSSHTSTGTHASTKGSTKASTKASTKGSTKASTKGSTKASTGGTGTHGGTGTGTHGGDHSHARTTPAQRATPPPPPNETPPTCSNTNITPTPENLEAVREVTLCLINRERIANGEHPLRLDSKLEWCAQGHSESMAQQDYFSHEGPEGSTPLSRMTEVGYIYSSNIGYEVGENIAWGTLWLATPQSIVESWMNSREHRANILDANYQDTGIGVDPQAPSSRSEGQPGALYTQDFGVIITG